MRPDDQRSPLGSTARRSAGAARPRRRARRRRARSAASTPGSSATSSVIGVPGRDAADVEHRQLGVRGLGDAGAADHVAAGDRDEVAEHRGRGLHSPGAGAVEHERRRRRRPRRRPRCWRRARRRADGCAARAPGRRAPTTPSLPVSSSTSRSQIARSFTTNPARAGGVDLLGGDARDALAVHRVDAARSCGRRGSRGSPPSARRRSRRCRRSGRPRRSRARWRSRARPRGEAPVVSMRSRMKFVVPFTMPRMRSTRSPARLSRSGRMIGIAPPTAAS